MSLYVNTEPENVNDLRSRIDTTLGKVDPHYREARYTLRYPLIRVLATKRSPVPDAKAVQ